MVVIFTCCLLQLLMLSVAIADVVCCNCLCCLLQLPLCCLLQLPMLSVAIAYVVRCNCLCCHLNSKTCTPCAFPSLQPQPSPLNPEPPPPHVPSTKNKNPKGAVRGHKRPWGCRVWGWGVWGCAGWGGWGGVVLTGGTYLDPALVSSHGHVHHPAPACATIGKSIPIYIA